VKKPEEGKPIPAREGAAPKKPYHAPLLREYGNLVNLTAKGTFGGDLSAKTFP
jgi:hypothetical protein